jgi:hypothetical protein
MSAEQSNQPNQPFIPQTERPEVKLTLDTPLSELRVRDLSMILAEQLRKKSESAIEQFSFPPKWWIDLSFSFPPKWWIEMPISSPLSPPQGAAALQDVIQAVTGLKDQMSKLSDQLNALQQKMK